MLCFSHVGNRFGVVQALVDCSFSVARGRMLGFVGPNGAGKTTAMRSVFGLVRLDGGEVLWNGTPGRARRAVAFRLHAGGAWPLPADAGRRAARLLRLPARTRSGRRTHGGRQIAPRTAWPDPWSSSRVARPLARRRANAHADHPHQRSQGGAAYVGWMFALGEHPSTPTAARPRRAGGNCTSGSHPPTTNLRETASRVQATVSPHRYVSRRHPRCCRVGVGAVVQVDRDARCRFLDRHTAAAAPGRSRRKAADRRAACDQLASPVEEDAPARFREAGEGGWRMLAATG